MTFGVLPPGSVPSYMAAKAADLLDAAFVRKADKMDFSHIMGPGVDGFMAHADVTNIKGIGKKTAAALEKLGVKDIFNFTMTRGGMGFAELQPDIGKAGVERLRALQAAFKACMGNDHEGPARPL